MLIVTGCVGASVRPQLHSDAAVRPMLASAASQVKRCYRAPRTSHAGRQIITTVRVRMTSEGFPDGPPRVVSQYGVTSTNSAFAERMAQAAIVAIVRCAPLRLPAELYQGGWQEFELTFSPVANA